MHLLQSKVGPGQVIVAGSGVLVIAVVVVVALQEARRQGAAGQGGSSPQRTGGRLIPPHHPGLLLDQPRPASRTTAVDGRSSPGAAGFATCQSWTYKFVLLKDRQLEIQIFTFN